MFNLWLAKVWFAFMDESQQYRNYHEIALQPSSSPH